MFEYPNRSIRTGTPSGHSKLKSSAAACALFLGCLGFPLLGTMWSGSAEAAGQSRDVSNASRADLLAAPERSVRAVGLLPAGGANEQWLLNQAQFWEERFNEDAALEALQKVLTINPQNQQALFNLGRHKAKGGDLEEARTYVSRLQAAGATEETIDSLLLLIRLYQDQGQRLDEARELARNGRNAEAVIRYNAIFGGTPPQGELAVEYYHTMSGLDGQWRTAVRGLEAELERNPGNRRAEFTLAEILTYQEGTRREGLRRLREFLSDSVFVDRAETGYRNALLWLGATVDDREIYEEYLRRNPDDASMREKYTMLISPPIIENASDLVNQGYRDLFEERLDQAEQAFESALRENANDGNAYAGLGLVRLRRQDFASAESAFERAVQADPNLLPKIGEAYTAAAFWRRYHAALEAKDAGDLDRAEALLFEIVDQDVEGRQFARLSIAGIYVDRGDLENAEVYYRELLQEFPDDPDVILGLVGLLQQRGEFEEAARLGQRLASDQRNEVGLDRLEAQLLRSKAAEARNNGQNRVARQQLDAALRKTPDDPWLRLEYARLLYGLGEIRAANNVMDVLVNRAGQSNDAKTALAIYAVSTEDYDKAVELLESVPPAERKLSDSDLLDQARFSQSLEIARREALAGEPVNARRILSKLQRQNEGDTDRLVRIAEAYLLADAPGTAVSLTRRILVDADIDEVASPTLIAAARVLSEVGERQDAGELLSALRMREDLPDDLSEQLSNLRLESIIELTREQMDSRQYSAAFDTLQPLLRPGQERPVVLRLAGELHQKAGIPERALIYYRQALETDPFDLYSIKGAVGAALQSGDLETATDVLEPAITRMPDEPDLYFLVAEVAQAAGDQFAAIEALEAAQKLERELQRRGGSMTEQPYQYGSNTWLGSLERRLAAAGYDTGQMVLTAAAAPAQTAGTPVSDGQMTWDGPALDLDLSFTAEDDAGGYPATDGPVILAQSTTETGAEASERIRRLLRNIREEEQPEEVQQQQEIDEAEIRRRRNRRVVPIDENVLEPSSAARFDIGRPASDPLSRRLSDLRWQVNNVGSQYLGFRFRTGEAGLSQLLELKTDLSVNMRAGSGRVIVTGTPVFVTSGADLTQADEIRRFGAQATTGGAFINQDQLADAGIALNAAYKRGQFSADLGITPLGFNTVNLEGGASYTFELSDGVFLTGTLERRAVTDSVLSYAGAEDPVTGESFGAVTRSGGRITLLRDFGGGGVYGTLAYMIYDGDGVDTNQYSEIGGGFFLNILEREKSNLQLGFNTTYFGFEENRRFFTLGHGGYFSPQQFISASVPVEYRVEEGLLDYGLVGAIGLQYFEEDDVAFFPEDSDLQSAAAAVAGPSERVIHDGNQEVQLSFRAGGDVNYRVGERLEMGARLLVDNAADYTETQGGLSLRYRFGDGSTR